MPNNIKPGEVSAVLLQQLQNISTEVQFEEVGTVLTVGDGVARIYGLSKVTENELIEFDNGVMAVAMNLEEDNVGAVILGSSEGIKEGDSVKRTGRVASIMVNENMLGRVINPLGNPLDGGGDIEGEKYLMPLDRKAPGVIYRQPVTESLATGLKSVDSMIPIGRGQRELIIGDRQTGKTAIAIDTIINQRQNFETGDPVYCIYVAIGQRHQPLPISSTFSRRKVLWNTPLWCPLPLPTAPHCNTMPPWQVPPSVNSSATEANTPS